MQSPVEGVVRFHAEHDDAPLTSRRFGALAGALLAWRDILFGLGLVGQDPARYGGAGYGNVSARVGPFPGARGARAFLISGTQTGGRACMGLDELCLVRRYDILHNRVESAGTTRPSSESMTHGAVYDLGPQVRFVLHGHCPAVWRRRRALRLPTTGPAVEYGTPQMAQEVGRLARDTGLLQGRVFAMGGHEDGVVSFGRSAEEAGQALLSTLAAALSVQYVEAGQICGGRYR